MIFKILHHTFNHSRNILRTINRNDLKSGWIYFRFFYSTLIESSFKNQSSITNITCPVSKKFSAMQLTATATADFKVVSQTKIFVDRTALLAQVVDHAFIVTAPPRMGKSTMLSMVKTFMQRTPDFIEKPFSIKGNPNYKYFKDLAIGENAQFMEKYFGQYPVIEVDFTSGRIKSKKDAINVIRRAVHEAYVKHEYLDDVLNDTGKATKGFRKTLNGWLDDCWINKSEDEVLSGLEELAAILHFIYKQKCYVLVDEHDSITRGAFGSVKDEEFNSIRHVVAESIGSLFKGPKAQQYVAGGIITGISNAHTGFPLSQLTDHLNHYKFLGNHDYNDFFVLYEGDVSKLLKKFKLEHELKPIRKYYHGYVGENGKHFYNSFSIFQYLKYQTFDTRWVTNGVIKELQPILQIPAIKDRIEELILGKTVTFDYKKVLSNHQFGNINHLMSNIQPKDKGKIENTDHDIMSYLLDQGYFSIISRWGYSGYEVTVPNEEVMNTLRKDLQEYYHQLFLTCREECDACGKCLVEILSATYYDEKESIPLVEESLKLFFKSLCSLLHKTGHPTPYIKEIFLRSLFISIFSMLRSVRHTEIHAKSTFSIDDNETNECEDKLRMKEVDFAGAIEDLSIIVDFKIETKNSPVKSFEQLNEMVHLGSVLKHKFIRDTDFCLILAVQLTLPEKSKNHASCDVYYDIRPVPESFKTLDKLKPESNKFCKQLEKLKYENNDFATGNSKNMKKLDSIEFDW